MEMLILGLAIWSIVHFIPSLAQPLKLKWQAALGEKGYMASFAIIIITSLGLIVFGWRSSTPEYLYSLPAFTKHIAMLMMVFAFILFGAAKYQTRIKRIIRHPQLTSIIVWASAHLMLNGDSRSVVLFSTMGVWAILEIILINKREKVWNKPAIPSIKLELRGLAISIVMLIVVVMLHPYIAGVSIK